MTGINAQRDFRPTYVSDKKLLRLEIINPVTGTKLINSDHWILKCV